MPYQGPNDPSLPDYVKKMAGKRRRQWVHIFQSAYSRCQAEGGKNCDASAFKQANGTVAGTPTTGDTGQ